MNPASPKPSSEPPPLPKLGMATFPSTYSSWAVARTFDMKCGAPEGLCHFPRTLGSFRSPLCWVLARLAFVVIAASLPISPYLSGPPSLQGSTVLTNFAQGMLLICAGAHLHPISQLAAQVPQRYIGEVHLIYPQLFLNQRPGASRSAPPTLT